MVANSRPLGVMPSAIIDTMPNTPGTKRRTIRIDDPTWEPAMEAAKDKDEILAEEIRAFVERYPSLPKRER